MAVPPLLLMLVVVLIAPLPLCVLSAPDSKGREFIFGYMENSNYYTQDVELYMSTSSNIPATVTVTLPLFDPSWIRTFTVSRGNVQNLTLPNAIRGKDIEKSNKAVWVRATEEISVYAVNLERTSTDAYIILPVDVLGTEYYAMCYQKDPEIMLVGVEDNTQVSITWPTSRPNGVVSFYYESTQYQNGDTLTLTLNRFETLHIEQDDDFADFTGAHITSLKPIAVISGIRRGSIPFRAGNSDHLSEMMMPVNTWGKDFISTSTPARSIGDLYRIVASESDTQVEVTGNGTYTLSAAGDFQELDIPTGQYVKITATKPVMIAMFTKTWKKDGSFGGDPAMTLILPEPQYDSDYTWVAVSSAEGDFNNMVVVIIEGNQKDGLRLDGKPVTWQEEKSVAGSTKVHLWAHITPGSHNLYHLDPLATFMLYASGSRSADSYGFLGGMRLADINSLCNPTCVVAGDVVDNDCDGSVDEEVLNGLDDDGDGQIDEDLARPLRVDGQWGDWEPWAPCSAPCGHGVTVRTRACDSPYPVNEGFFCSGIAADAAYCHAGSCLRPREDKTCELTSGQVDTFESIRGSFAYNCLFRASSLDRFRVHGHRLMIDIYTAYMDNDTFGDVHVSKVVIVVGEVCLHPVPRTSTFNVTADDIRNLYNGLLSVQNPDDPWTIDDPNGYRNYLCFGYDNGQVTFYVNTGRDGCIPVVNYAPRIQASGITPGVVITVDSSLLSRHGLVSFPHSLCAGRHERAFEKHFRGLATTQQKILYALLDQNVMQLQSNTRCVDAVQAFQVLTDTEKKAAVERCESTDLSDLADCIGKQK